MTIIGIDPGLSGGLAALDGETIDLLIMPVVAVGLKREIDEQTLVDWLASYKVRGDVQVIIEAVHAMPKQGVTSMFTFGTGWGLVRGICAGLGIPYRLVRPQEWQRVVMPGMARGSEYCVASRLWPLAEFRASGRCRKPHEGLVDAALIAEYGRIRR